MFRRWSMSTCRFRGKKIYKGLHALDFLVKNGAPRIVQDLKDDLYKIRTLQDMQYTVDGVDKTAGIREKAKTICELVSEPSRLEEEREFSRKNRDKFRGQGSEASNTGPGYKGFGSEDLRKYGGPDSYTPGSNYDPYKKESISRYFPIQSVWVFHFDVFNV